jgi:hypothetical protein
MTSNKTDQDTNNIDYLDVDPEIRGQKYCSISFAEPTIDRFAHKESFMMSKFLKQYTQILYIQFCKNHDVKVSPTFVWDTTKLYEQFIDFKAIEYDDMCKEYEKQEGDVTHMRMFKIRGVFNTLTDAKERCEMLHEQYPHDQIGVAPVGMWGPYAPPNFNDIKDIVYSEEKMQQFMKENLENEKGKRMVETKRKNEMMDQIKVDHETSPPIILESSSSTQNGGDEGSGKIQELELSLDVPLHLQGELELDSVPLGVSESSTNNNNTNGVYTAFPYQ